MMFPPPEEGAGGGMYCGRSGGGDLVWLSLRLPGRKSDRLSNFCSTYRRACRCPVHLLVILTTTAWTILWDPTTFIESSEDLEWDSVDLLTVSLGIVVI